MRFNREEFLHNLELLTAGLSSKEVFEQSGCFIFSKGKISTFNNEIFCSIKSKYVDLIECAVTATPLLKILHKMTEEEIEIDLTPKEMLVIGKRKRFGIAVQTEIVLQFDKMEKPTKWKELHEDFTEAVSMASAYAGKDADRFATTCVNIHPKWIEAFDNIQMLRFKLKTNIDKQTLVKRDAIKHITGLGVTELAETTSWLHFRNAGKGLVIAVRRYIEDFLDLTPHLKVEGIPAQLPKGLGESIECAEVFSSENSDENLITVDLKPGKMRIKGSGMSGWYTEMKSINYKGPAISFCISPKLLKQITTKYNDCLISPTRLKVDGGSWNYVTVLGTIEEKV